MFLVFSRSVCCLVISAINHLKGQGRRADSSGGLGEHFRRCFVACGWSGIHPCGKKSTNQPKVATLAARLERFFMFLVERMLQEVFLEVSPPVTVQ